MYVKEKLTFWCLPAPELLQGSAICRLDNYFSLHQTIREYRNTFLFLVLW